MGSNPILSAILYHARPADSGRAFCIYRASLAVFVIIEEFFDIQIQLFKDFRQRCGTGFRLLPGFIPADAIACPISRDVYGRDKDDVKKNEKRDSHGSLLNNQR
jgi:hypothetical protein